MVISRSFKNGYCHAPVVSIEIDEVSLIIAKTEVEARKRAWVELDCVPCCKMSIDTDLVVWGIDYHAPANILCSFWTNAA